MRKQCNKAVLFIATTVGVLMMLPVQAAEKLYGAPATATVTSDSSGASLSKMTLALVVVLAFVFLAAWVVKQTRRLQLGKTGTAIEIVAQVALGTKERAVLLKVGEVQVLVGVAPGQVHALHVLSAGESAATQVDTVSDPTSPVGTAPISFQSILKRSLGLSK